MGSNRRGWGKKYLYYLAIISIFFILSCEETDQFKIILEPHINGGVVAGTFVVEDITNGDEQRFSIGEDGVDIDIDMNKFYNFTFFNNEYIGYIESIQPKDFDKIIVPINVKNGLKKVIVDQINQIETCYLYDNYNFWFFNNFESKKYIFLTRNFKDISLKIGGNCINIDGKVIINSSSIYSIQNSEVITSLDTNLITSYSDYLYTKINNTDYFIVLKGEESKCFRYQGDKNSIIMNSSDSNCISNIEEQLEGKSYLFENNGEIYLWNNKNLYNYRGSKFELSNSFEIDGTPIVNGGELYLIGDNIIKIDLTNYETEFIIASPIQTPKVNVINGEKVLISERCITTQKPAYIFNFNTKLFQDLALDDSTLICDFKVIKLDQNQSFIYNENGFSIDNAEYEKSIFYLFTNSIDIE